MALPRGIVRRIGYSYQRHSLNRGLFISTGLSQQKTPWNAIGMTWRLSGCDKSMVGTAASGCASEDAKSIIQSLVSEQIEKAAKSELSNGNEAALASESKIRATASLLKISLQDIRTAKEDPNSTKRFCAGTLNIVAPLNMIKDADQVLSTINSGTIEAAAQRSGIDRSADIFSHGIEYAVQPTDDGRRKEDFRRDRGLQ